MPLLSPCLRRSLEHRGVARFSSAWWLGALFPGRHRHTRDLHIDREETASGGEVKRSPILAAKCDVCGGGVSVDNTTEFPALWIDDVKTAGAAAVEIPL